MYYGGISINSTVAKLCGKVIRNTLEETIQCKIEKHQAVFSVDNSCRPLIHNKTIVKRKKESEVHLAFIDIENSYHAKVMNSQQRNA